MTVPSIDIRFMTDTGSMAEWIRYQAGTSMPFTPSHAETLTKDGKWYIGAHIRGGILKRPVGYDADTLMTLSDGSKSERIIKLACTQAQEDAFYAFVEKSVGEEYDWQGILGFVLTEMHLHQFGKIFCSAFMTAGLRTKGCEWFRWPLTKPFHKISPDFLFAILSSHVEIPH